MKKNLLLSLPFYFLLIATQNYAQCTFRTTAIATGDTLHCSGGDYYRTAVAFNPVHQLYYSVDAGGTTPDEVFDINGNQVYSSISMDWRGLWWNTNTNQLEGNTWGNYLVIDSLQATGYLGGTFNSVGSTTTPNVQCAGVYDPTLDMIYYYNSGTLYGESRSSLVDMTPLPLTGLTSFTSIHDPTLIYTGCAGNEIGLYDMSAQKIYLFNKSTGALATTINMPVGTIFTSYLGGNFAFANNIVWLYNLGINKWVGFDIFQPAVGIGEIAMSQVSIYPNPTSSTLKIEVKEQTQITIVNALGEVVKTETIKGLSTIDVTELSTGVYFIQSNTGIKTKFIKQ